MKSTYLGAQKVIDLNGVLYRFTEAAKDAVTQLEWALNILKGPNTAFKNGRTSHECAAETLARVEDVLLSNRIYTLEDFRSPHAAKVAAIKSLTKQAQPLPVRPARIFNPF